jgi:glucose/arabinose dehydrogenase
VVCCSFSSRSCAEQVVASDWRSPWKYFQASNTPEGDWTQPTYDDSGWSNRAGCFAFPSNKTLIPGASFGTALAERDTNGVAMLTRYFRTTFFVSDTATSALTFTNLLDDGGVIYLNGVEVKRFGMDVGLVTYTNRANRSVEVNTGGPDVFTTDTAPGTNIVAVELHQALSSTDSVFGMKIVYESSETMLRIIEQPQDAAVTQGDDVTFAVTVSGSNPKYQWHDGTNVILGATNSVYQLSRVTMAQNGNVYSVTVSNPISSVRSRDAVLRPEVGPINAYGLTERRTNSTLQFGSPPALPYQVVNAFPGLGLGEIVAIVSPPGETNRLFVLERSGGVIVITNLAAPTRTVFMDISPRIVRGGECGLLGLAFHPGYHTNRYFFLFYSTLATSAHGTNRLHQVLSRFEASQLDSSTAEITTEVRLLTMFDETDVHNAGDLHFGADGYLYVSMGDESISQPSTFNAQSIDRDFWSGILRLDVDNRPENVVPNPHPAIGINTFRVPADNPFFGVTNWNGSNVGPSNVRTEFYAIGFRNPWRMSFDPLTGYLYCGDVGFGLREEIDVVIRGGNYGWAFREGLFPGPRVQPVGAVPMDPILDYAEEGAQAVIGGLVYRGSRFPDLYGSYIFGDYISGKIWSVYYDGVRTQGLRQIATSVMNAFGADPHNGDILVAGAGNTRLGRLVSLTNTSNRFPSLLSDTGIFTNLATLAPQPGILPYAVNIPSTTDAAPRNWFAVRGDIEFDPTKTWRVSAGSTFVQHFDLELTNGVPESRRRIETRVLIGVGGSNLLGASYRWDAGQTNASLVSSQGTTEVFQVYDGENARTHVWSFPSRESCLTCHHRTDPGRQLLGFNAPQLNRERLFENGIADNQIRALDHVGYFGSSLNPQRRHLLRALAQPTDETISVEQRVRSQLAAHCAGCHQPETGIGFFDARISTPLSETRLINGRLLHDGTNNARRVIVPGSLSGSALFHRISAPNAGHATLFESSLVSTQMVELVRRWIVDELPAYQTFSQWQIGNFEATNAPGSASTEDFDGDGARNFLEYLAATDPLDPGQLWSISGQRDNDMLTIIFPRIANRGFEVDWSDDASALSNWRGFDVAANKPFISASNAVTHVTTGIMDGPRRFYRVRVFEP